MTDTTPAPKKKRGPPPQDPAHGALSPTERTARHRKQLAQHVQAAIERPSEAHTLPRTALVQALAVQLAQLDADNTAQHRARAVRVVQAIADKYNLPVITEQEVEFDFQVDTSTAATQPCPRCDSVVLVADGPGMWQCAQCGLVA